MTQTQNQLRLKRGGYARDARTGQIVRIKEWGGTDALVAPAYKSDGQWVNRSQLTPVRDPHEWTSKTWLKFLVVLIIATLTAYGPFHAFRSHGISLADSLVYAFPAWLLLLGLGGRWTGVTRD